MAPTWPLRRPMADAAAHNALVAAGAAVSPMVRSPRGVAGQLLCSACALVLRRPVVQWRRRVCGGLHCSPRAALIGAHREASAAVRRWLAVRARGRARHASRTYGLTHGSGTCARRGHLHWMPKALRCTDAHSLSQACGITPVVHGGMCCALSPRPPRRPAATSRPCPRT